MVVLLSGSSEIRRWQEYEIRTFLRQAASDERSRLLIPFTKSETKLDDIPKFLRQYHLTPLRGDYDAAADHISKLIHSSTKDAKNNSRTTVLRMRTTTDGDTPIKGVNVTALAKNGTTIDTQSEEDGRAVLELLDGRAYTLLFAHPTYPAKIIDDFTTSAELPVRLTFYRGIGSLIIHSTGYIPGLRGRLNPILDTSNRTYLYADNIAVNGGEQQPATFKINEPFELEDAIGARFEVTVKLIAGRTSLLQYRKLD